MTQNLEKFELGIALNKIIDFIWDEFCDWYIEMIKPRLYDQSHKTHRAAQWLSREILIGSLKLLHPFMPFFTTEIHRLLIGVKDSEDLMCCDWPSTVPEWTDEVSDKQVRMIMDATKQIRALRLELQVPVKRKAPLLVCAQTPEIGSLFEASAPYLERLANVSEIRVVDRADVPQQVVSAVVEGAQLFMPLDALIDLEQEKSRLKKEVDRLQEEVKRFESKLGNAQFVNKAPAAVVQAERDKQAAAQSRLEKLEQQLAHLG